MEGWIKLHRSISDNSIWTSEPFSRGQALVDLFLLASHKDSFFYKRGVKVEVKRGQLAWSERSLSERWKWSRTKLRKFINDLEKEQQIIPQKNNVIQVITIVNYDKYQEKEPQTIPQTIPQKDHRKTTDHTTERPIQECIKNNKKKKNVKNEKEKKEEGLIFPFDSENFKNEWCLWKKYKKEQFKFEYKGILSEQGALKKLSELSGSNEEKAVRIMRESISNGWQGLFDLKNKNNEQSNTEGQVQYSDEFKRKIYEKLQSG